MQWTKWWETTIPKNGEREKERESKKKRDKKWSNDHNKSLNFENNNDDRAEKRKGERGEHQQHSIYKFIWAEEGKKHY